MKQRNQVPECSVEHTLREIRKLPSLPTLIVEIMNSIDGDKGDVAAIVRKISQDQSLVARIMRVANSPFFGFSRQIGTIGQAITVLGFASLRSLVTAAAVIRAFPRMPEHFGQTQFWRHSISVGTWARVLAKRSGLNPETAFTAGLLHDIGELVIVAHFSEGFRCVEDLVKDGMHALSAQRAVFGMDHAALGARVAENWNFPPEITRAVKEHHNPLKSGDEVGLTDAVYVANLLVHAMKGTGAMADNAGHAAGEAWVRLDIDGATLEILAEEVEQLCSGAFMLIGE